MKSLVRLCCTVGVSLALAAPAAGENLYTYYDVDTTEPRTCQSPCEVSWPIAIPDDVLPSLVVVKKCGPGWPRPVRDRHITLYASGQQMADGTIDYTLGDNFPRTEEFPEGRTQTWCLKVSFPKVRLPPPDEDEALGVRGRGRE